MALKTSWKLLLFVWACSFDLYGQSNYLLDYFKVFRAGDKIMLIWQMGKGNQCSGLAIHRSTNGQSFDKIGEIQGICGSDTLAQFYSFTDDAPIPGKMHQYTLELGFFGKTDPSVGVFFPDFSANTSQVIPNPLADEGKVIFSNPRGEEHNLLVYDVSGRLLDTKNTREEVFSIHADEYYLKNGRIGLASILLYYQILNISNKSEVSSGKIILLNIRK